MAERILILKTSSMGDILHALPALTDAAENNPNTQFDWLVDSSFADIVKLHPAVSTVYALGIRQWRQQNPLVSLKEYKNWRHSLPKTPYDLILDCQGLWKSAVIGRTIKGPLAGFDKHGAREQMATLLYNRKIYSDRRRHAVLQLRDLFAKTLGYAHPHGDPVYSIRKAISERPLSVELEPNSVMCFHGTTWPNKHFPEKKWQQVLRSLVDYDLRPVLSYGNKHELARAENLKALIPEVRILDKMPLMELARVLCEVSGTIGLDTGLSHLAAALEIPSVALFGPTRPDLSGPLGKNQQIIQAQFDCAPCSKRKCQIEPHSTYAPCWQSIDAQNVVDSLKTIMENQKNG